MNLNYVLTTKKYFAYPCGVVLMAFTITSCQLPKALSSKDSLSAPKNFTHVPDSTQKKVTLPVWRNFFQDSLLIVLIDSALKNNVDLKIAEQRIFKAQAGFNFSRKALYPNLNAKGSMGTTQYGDYTENGVGNFDTNLSNNISPEQKIPAPVPDAFLGLQTSWEIGFAGKLRNRKKSAYYNYLSEGEFDSAQLKTYLFSHKVFAGLSDQQYYQELIRLDFLLKPLV